MRSDPREALPVSFALFEDALGPPLPVATVEYGENGESVELMISTLGGCELEDGKDLMVHELMGAEAKTVPLETLGETDPYIILLGIAIAQGPTGAVGEYFDAFVCDEFLIPITEKGVLFARTVGVPEVQIANPGSVFAGFLMKLTGKSSAWSDDYYREKAAAAMEGAISGLFEGSVSRKSEGSEPFDWSRFQMGSGKSSLN